MPANDNKPIRTRLRTYGRSRAPRLPEYDYRGCEVIHVTTCAAVGRDFNDPAVATMICENVEFYCESMDFRLFGYCLMPDHLHLLLSPDESGHSLADWLQRFKSFTSHSFVKLGGQAPLWQRSAYDHVCRKLETAGVVMRYIADNPVRAGLVQCWSDWPYTKVCV